MASFVSVKKAGIIVWDLDRVLFATDKFVKDLSNLLAASGISNRTMHETLFKLKLKSIPFSVENFLNAVSANPSHNIKNGIKKNVFNLLSNKNYFYPWIYRELERFKKAGFSHQILSFGDKKFQNQKIRLSGGKKITPYFDKIKIIKDSKLDYLKKVVSRNPETPIFFVDDFGPNIKEVEKHIPEINTIHYKNPKSLSTIKIPWPKQAVILLGGENSRFWPLGQKRHKALYEVGDGQPILFYLLKECERVGLEEIILVRRPQDKGLDSFIKTARLNNLKIKSVVQYKPRGMADAVLRARHLIKNGFFVFDGNQIFFSKIYRHLLLLTRKFDAILTTRMTINPFLFGVVLTNKKGLVKNIVEKPKKKEYSQQRITATYYLEKTFLKFLVRYSTDKDSGFERAISDYAKEHEVFAIPIDRLVPEITLKYPWDLFDIHNQIINQNNLIDFPKIDPTAKIHPAAKIKGKSVIGKKAIIKANSLIKSSFIDKSVEIGKGCIIKNSIIYMNTKIGDNCCIFDSIIDRNCYIGMGTIIQNISDKEKSVKIFVKDEWIDSQRKKMGAIIGESVKIKNNQVIKAGVKIGLNLKTGQLIEQ